LLSLGREVDERLRAEEMGKEGYVTEGLEFLTASLKSVPILNERCSTNKCLNLDRNEIKISHHQFQQQIRTMNSRYLWHIAVSVFSTS
jgi:hypothetical protein